MARGSAPPIKTTLPKGESMGQTELQIYTLGFTPFSVRQQIGVENGLAELFQVRQTAIIGNYRKLKGDYRKFKGNCVFCLVFLTYFGSLLIHYWLKFVN